MVKDDERREVARRLRELDYSDLQESLICSYSDALGIEGYEDWVGIAHRLADLIEPSEQKVKCIAEVKIDGEWLEKLAHDAAAKLTGIDRDALLKLADEIEDNNVTYYVSTQYVLDSYARRIREALGVVG